MVEHLNENLDDLMMGEVSEELSESDEVFAARVAAAQVKLKKIKKDETKAKDFDQHLSKILRTLSPRNLDIVIFFIDHEVPSLTILAILSVIHDEAGKICFMEFEKYIESRADFSKANLPASLEEKISYWWTFIYGADHISTTLNLRDLKDNHDFIVRLSKYLGQLLQEFVVTHKIENFDQAALKKILQKYQTEIFADK